MTRDPIAEGEATQPPAARIRPAASSQIRDPERYRIIGEHGRGGLGRVSRAHDRELHRDVAIKELISSDQAGEERFLREALITARLEHPGIVAVHEAGRWPDGTPFYAMKLVSGRPLRDIIAERPTVEDRRELLHHLIAVADAIAYAHGCNIIHRDLKPSNVIVGEFGETVVIDWGLAKELGTTDPGIVRAMGSTAIGSSDRALTVEGSVMGTPAYMPPEQKRGEVVDKRADVFAIGAMLWELCALQREPPADAAERRRILRGAAVDPDLAAIVDKALDPDPARRYADAGALASDLKAFKAGARVSSRRYSLAALFAHWIRRHRALALSIAIALVVIALGAALFVWNLAVARDRAETANGELTLERAALLLQSDPTVSLQVLQSYRGNDELRRDRLRAEAVGRGVADQILAPHTDTVWLAVGEPSGAIVTVGEDRRIQLTVGPVALTLATDVSPLVRLAYEPGSRLIAYATSPLGISVLDLTTHQVRSVAAFDPEVMVFSLDGARLAAISRDGDLRVWSTAPGTALTYQQRLPGANRVRFATTSRLVVRDSDAIRAVPLDASGGAADVAVVRDLSSVDASPTAVVAGTMTGEIVMLSANLTVLGRTALCSNRVRIVRWIPGSDHVAFACQDPRSGVARYDATSGSFQLLDAFATGGSPTVYPDITGNYITISDDARAYIYDTRTRIQHHYDGAAGQPSYVAGPSPDYPHVLIGDVNGTVRVWDAPASGARVVAQVASGAVALAFSPDSTTLVAGGIDQAVHHIELATGRERLLRGHTSVIRVLRMAPDGATFMSNSYDGQVRVWSTDGTKLVRSFAEHGAIVEDAAYVDGGRGLVSVGEDGRLLAWSPVGGPPRVLFHHHGPLRGLRFVPRTEHAGERVVVYDGRGMMWEVTLAGAVRPIREPGSEITAAQISKDGRYAAIGTVDATVELYDAITWQRVRQIHTQGTIRGLAFDPHNRDLAIASEAGRTPLGHVQVEPLDGAPRATWREIAARVRHVSYAPDGETLAFVCDDGGTWLYSLRSRTWVFTRDHDTDTLIAAFSPDGRMFASGDRRGLVVVRDLAATFPQMRN